MRSLHLSALLPAVLLGLAACSTTGGHKAITTDVLEPYECGTITRLHTFGGIFTASQPAEADFEQAQKGGVVTVVNMRHPDEVTGFDEPAVVAQLGMSYVTLPWNGAAELTDDVFDGAREIFNTAERPMLVHCSSSNRVGAVWLPWRVLDGGISYEAALAEAKVVGVKTPAYIEKATDYIRRKGGGI